MDRGGLSVACCNRQQGLKIGMRSLPDGQGAKGKGNQRSGRSVKDNGRRRNIVLSFSHDTVTTEHLKTYNVHRAIGAQRARGPSSERIDHGKVLSAIEKTVASPRSTADSEPEKLYVREPDWRLL
ncbi:hypothetical protein TNCV_5062571 [Trichonephila clavipes]|nr:hypothetical protein TNCV_5062571 [Trichonephila clavipes]